MCHTDSYNRKGWYSIIIQAVEDHYYLFTDIYVSCAGSVHDAIVFGHSTLYEKATEGDLLPTQIKTISNVNVPLFLLGDSAYPLQTWLMKPFPEASATTQQKNTTIELPEHVLLLKTLLVDLREDGTGI